MNVRQVLRFPARSASERGGIIAGVVIVLGLIVLIAVAYGVFVMTWSYSRGDRAGYLQKFSQRGFVFKTWEGELAMTTVPGVAPVMWQFSVRDDRVAAEVSAALGKWVVLHYSERRGLPVNWFAETNYWVDSVRVEVSPIR